MKEVYAIIELIKYGDYDESNAESKIIEISFDKEEIEKECNLLIKNTDKIIDNKWKNYCNDNDDNGCYLEIYYYIQELKIKM